MVALRRIGPVTRGEIVRKGQYCGDFVLERDVAVRFQVVVKRWDVDVNQNHSELLLIFSKRTTLVHSEINVYVYSRTSRTMRRVGHDPVGVIRKKTGICTNRTSGPELEQA